MVQVAAVEGAQVQTLLLLVPQVVLAVLVQDYLVLAVLVVLEVLLQEELRKQE